MTLRGEKRASTRWTGQLNVHLLHWMQPSWTRTRRASSIGEGVSTAGAASTASTMSRLPERARSHLPDPFRERRRGVREDAALRRGGRSHQEALLPEAEGAEDGGDALHLVRGLEVPALVVARSRVAADNEDAVEAALAGAEDVVRVHHPRAHQAEDADGG